MFRQLFYNEAALSCPARRNDSIASHLRAGQPDPQPPLEPEQLRRRNVLSNAMAVPVIR